jgi:hypothetical protein
MDDNTPHPGFPVKGEYLLDIGFGVIGEHLDGNQLIGLHGYAAEDTAVFGAEPSDGLFCGLQQKTGDFLLQGMDCFRVAHQPFEKILPADDSGSDGGRGAARQRGGETMGAAEHVEACHQRVHSCRFGVGNGKAFDLVRRSQ